MRGTKPKPTNIRPFTGNKRPGSSAVGPQEPPVVAPDPPSYLTRAEKKTFRETAKILAEMRVMTEADVAALAMYCEQFHVMREAMDTVKAEGQTQKSERTGFICQHPGLGTANKALDRCLRILTEFGLTPSARSRLTSG